MRGFGVRAIGFDTWDCQARRKKMDMGTSMRQMGFRWLSSMCDMCLEFHCKVLSTLVVI